MLFLVMLTGLFKFYFIVFLALIFGLTNAKASNSCSLLASADAYRNFIEQVHNKYLLKGGEISLYLGPEHRVLSVDKTPGQRVLSIGSGPDVLRPLFDFPYAEHIYLLDDLTGWGDSFDDAFQELRSRLAFLSDNQFQEKTVSQEEIVWKISWGPQGIKRTTFIHLYKIDYNKTSSVEKFVNGMESPFTAIFTTGAPIPTNRSLDLILKATKPESPILTDCYKLRPYGQWASYIPASFIRPFLEDSQYVALKLGRMGYLRTEIPPDENAGLYSQYVYFYSRKNNSAQ
jgi:hypothetical protein